MDSYLARLAINRRQLEIRISIFRVFAVVGTRSKEMTMEQAIDGLPDALKEAGVAEFVRMVEEYLLWAAPSLPRGFYIINPNKRDIIKQYLTGQIAISSPLEELIPEGFEKEIAFKTTGAKDSKGTVATYYYYRSKHDRYHYVVFIQSSISQRPEKKDLGSLRDKTSVLSTVLDATTKLQKNNFIKADLDPLIPNRRIIQNRQPVKAAIDVLEYLGYVRKTGKRIGRSEQYERTDKQPVEEGLDKFFGEDFKV